MSSQTAYSALVEGTSMDADHAMQNIDTSAVPSMNTPLAPLDGGNTPSSLNPSPLSDLFELQNWESSTPPSDATRSLATPDDSPDSTFGPYPVLHAQRGSDAPPSFPLLANSYSHPEFFANRGGSSLYAVANTGYFRVSLDFNVEGQTLGLTVDPSNLRFGHTTLGGGSNGFANDAAIFGDDDADDDESHPPSPSDTVPAGINGSEMIWEAEHPEERDEEERAPSPVGGGCWYVDRLRSRRAAARPAALTTSDDSHGTRTNAAASTSSASKSRVKKTAKRTRRSRATGSLPPLLDNPAPAVLEDSNMMEIDESSQERDQEEEGDDSKEEVAQEEEEWAPSSPVHETPYSSRLRPRGDAATRPAALAPPVGSRGTGTNAAAGTSSTSKSPAKKSPKKTRRKKGTRTIEDRTCPACSRILSTVHNCDRHLRVCEVAIDMGMSKRERWKCPVPECIFYTSRADNCRQHMAIHDPTDLPPYLLSDDDDEGEDEDGDEDKENEDEDA